MGIFVVENYYKLKEEDDNSIVFNCSGAIDFTAQMNIELSLEHKEGFTECHPLNLIWKINNVKNIQNIITAYFSLILKRVPHISDRNEDLPLEKRFTKVYYKCYKKFYHSHWYSSGKDYAYTDFSLDDAIEYIIKENLSITMPKRDSIKVIF
jgi:hypothetical protein